MLKSAFIGAGYIAGVQISQLKRLTPEVEVVAVVDSDWNRAQELAQRFQIPRVSTDHRTVLEDPEIHVIHNCTPNFLHYPINREALERGKHVLSEKPLAITHEEGQKLAQLAREKGLQGGVNFCYRYYPMVQEMAARIRRGDLGEPHLLKGNFFQDHLLSSESSNWRLDPKLSGISSMVADLGSHWVDMAQFVTGMEIKEVFADMAIVHEKRKFGDRWKACTLEDIGNLMIRFESGARGLFSASQMCPGRKGDFDLQIYGSKRGLAWNHERPNQLWEGNRLEANRQLWESPILQDPESSPYALLPSGHPIGYHDAMFMLFRDFYEGIRSGNQAKNFPDFEAGARQLALVEAAVASHEKGGWETVQQKESSALVQPEV